MSPPASRSPTAAGQTVRGQVARAGRIFEMMMGVRPNRADDFMPPAPRALLLGVCSSLSCGRARQAIKSFAPQARDIQLLISALPSDEVVRRVRQGGLDVGLVCEPGEPKGCRAEPLWHEALFVVLPETHRLSRENAVAPADLRGETLLSTRRDPPGAQTWLSRSQAWPLMALQPLEADRETLFNLVALEFGIAVTSGSALGAYYPGVVYRPLLGCEAAVPYRVIWRDEPGHPGLPPFLEAMRQAARAPEVRR